MWWSRQAECWKAQRCSSQHCCLLSQDSSVGQAEARGQWTPWCQVVWERDRPPTLQLGGISMGERAGAPAVPTPLFGKGCKFHWMRKDRRYWFRLTYWQLCVPRWQLYPFDSWRIFRLERRWGRHNWGGNVRQTGGEAEQALQWLASIHIWATVKNKEGGLHRKRTEGRSEKRCSKLGVRAQQDPTVLRWLRSREYTVSAQHMCSRRRGGGHGQVQLFKLAAWSLMQTLIGWRKETSSCLEFNLRTTGGKTAVGKRRKVLRPQRGE